MRIKRADLPGIQNLEKTFERMRAEREREAADEIARGNEATNVSVIASGEVGEKGVGGRIKRLSYTPRGRRMRPALISMRRRSVRIKSSSRFIEGL